MSQHRAEGERSLVDIVGGLAGDVQDLVRGEIALAKAEMEQKFQRIAGAGASMAAGGVVALAGTVVLLFGIAEVLAFVMATWLALLLVGVVALVIGAVLVRSGAGAMSAGSLAPDRTAANLQRDANMLKEHT